MNSDGTFTYTPAAGYTGDQGPATTAMITTKITANASKTMVAHDAGFMAVTVLGRAFEPRPPDGTAGLAPAPRRLSDRVVVVEADAFDGVVVFLESELAKARRNADVDTADTGTPPQ